MTNTYYTVIINSAWAMTYVNYSVGMPIEYTSSLMTNALFLIKDLFKQNMQDQTTENVEVRIIDSGMYRV